MPISPFPRFWKWMQAIVPWELCLIAAGPSVGPAVTAAGVSVVPPAERPVTSLVTERRTAPSTASQHSNVHHLLRSVGEIDRAAANSPGLVSNAVSALFRNLDSHW